MQFEFGPFWRTPTTVSLIGPGESCRERKSQNSRPIECDLAGRVDQMLDPLQALSSDGVDTPTSPDMLDTFILVWL